MISQMNGASPVIMTEIYTQSGKPRHPTGNTLPCHSPGAYRACYNLR